MTDGQTPPWRVRRQAAAWVERRAHDPWSPAEEAEFQRWRAADPSHGAAYDAAAAVWSDPALSEALVRFSEAPARPRWGTLGFAAAVGTMAALAALVFIALPFLQAPQTTPVAPAHFASAAGERHTVTLSDGTVMALNAGARAVVRLSRRAREVELQAGEAFFEVASDAERPFSVQTPSGVVTAIGTAFNVDLYRDAVIVTVAEGRVAAAAAGGVAEILAAGDQIEIGRDGSTTLARVDPAAAGGWRTGWLETQSLTLGRLAERISRETGLAVTFTDPTLSRKTVSGRFRTRDPRALLENLGSVHTFTVVERDGALEISAIPDRH